MPTVLQENLADEIIKNTKRKRKKNLGQLVESGGYSKTVAEAKPGEIIAQKGVQEALEEKGFSATNARRVVGEILDNEKIDPGNRIRAAQEVFKVTGEYAPEKHETATVIVDISKILEKTYGNKE